MDGFLFSIAFLVICSLINLTIGHDKCHPRIYGPGWDDPSLVLPSRYFFIDIPNGCDLSISNVEVASPKGVRDRGCLIKTRVMSETSTGVVIVRYRVVSPSCQEGISITIYDQHNQVISRKDVTKAILGEDCTCRIDDFNERFKCEEDQVSNEGVHRDLKPWQDTEGNFSVWLDEAVKRFASFPRSYSFCHYKIKSNEVSFIKHLAIRLVSHFLSKTDLSKMLWRIRWIQSILR